MPAGALGPEIKRMMAGTAEGRALISIYCFGGMGCQAVKTRKDPQLSWASVMGQELPSKPAVPAPRWEEPLTHCCLVSHPSA